VSNESNAVNTSSEKQEKERVRREEWKKAKEFEKDGIVVIVSKLPLRLPRYSIEIASRTQFGDQKIGRHFQIHVDRKSGKANVTHIAIRSLVALVSQAEKYIEDEEQLDLNAFIEWKKNKDNVEAGVVGDSEDDEVLIEKK
jgi:hypothetical protein